MAKPQRRSSTVKPLLVAAFLAGIGAIGFRLYVDANTPTFENETIQIDMRPDGPAAESRRERQEAIQREHAQRWYESNLAETGLNWPAGESPWFEKRKNLAADVIVRKPYDVLVVPLQMQGRSFDPIERSLVSRVVTQAITNLSDLHPADASMVFRYFGGNRTSYEQDEVRSLAKEAGIEKVVVLEAAFAEVGEYDFTISIHDAALSGPNESKTWNGLGFDAEQPPFIAIESIASEIAEFVAGQEAAPDRRVPGETVEKLELPETVEAMTAASKASPIVAAAYLQIVGMMHPGWTENEVRNQLFERSLVELAGVEPDAPHAKYLRARALAYLDRRPAALRVLAAPETRHEQVLKEALDGNLDKLREHSKNFEVSVFDFLLWRDLLRVESAYGLYVERPLYEQFAEAYPEWAGFVGRAFDETSRYSFLPTFNIKINLDMLIDGKVPSSNAQQAQIVSDMAAASEHRAAQLVHDHVDARLEQHFHTQGTGWPATNYVSTADILELARTMAVANHERAVLHDLRIKVLPDAALERIDEFEDLYAGVPSLTFLKGEAQELAAKEAPVRERLDISRESAKSKLDALAWTGQLDSSALSAVKRYVALVRTTPYGVSQPSPPSGERYPPHPRLGEWPRGAVWYRDFSVQAARNGAFVDCLKFTWTTVWCLDMLVREPQHRKQNARQLEAGAYLARFDHRFGGHPQRTLLLAHLARSGVDTRDEITVLREQIESGSADWYAYRALGRLHFRQGDYRAAQETWLSFPGFARGSNYDRIARSNHADVTGSNLYWIGQHELATPLLRISANSNTGSGAEMASSQRLALINRDYKSAISWSNRRISRYGSSYAKRDLIQVLHMLGHSEDAWTVFDESLDREMEVHVWQGPLIGHRMDAASLADVVEWLEDSDDNRKTRIWSNGRQDGESRAARYLLQYGIMDGSPEDGLELLVRQVEGEARPKAPYQYKEDEEDPFENSDLAGTVQRMGFRYKNPQKSLFDPAGEWAPDSWQEVETRYELIARSMTAFNRGDYTKAYDAFSRLARLYDPQDFVSYYAFTAAVVGRGAHLHEWLEVRDGMLGKQASEAKITDSLRGYRFDEDLTHGVLEALDGNHEAGIKYLNSALNNRPFKEDRLLFPLYQLVDVCEHLYARTGEDAYREFALELARRHTVVLPMYAWAYFVVAEYSGDEEERVEAAASGFALDSNSYRGSQLPANLRTGS